MYIIHTLSFQSHTHTHTHSLNGNGNKTFYRKQNEQSPRWIRWCGLLLLHRYLQYHLHNSFRLRHVIRVERTMFVSFPARIAEGVRASPVFSDVKIARKCFVHFAARQSTSTLSLWYSLLFSHTTLNNNSYDLRWDRELCFSCNEAASIHPTRRWMYS